MDIQKPSSETGEACCNRSSHALQRPEPQFSLKLQNRWNKKWYRIQISANSRIVHFWGFWVIWNRNHFFQKCNSFTSMSSGNDRRTVCTVIEGSCALGGVCRLLNLYFFSPHLVNSKLKQIWLKQKKTQFRKIACNFQLVLDRASTTRLSRTTNFGDSKYVWIEAY